MTLLDELMGEVKRDAYDKLPESIKATIARNEWLWLSDKQKMELVTHECEPASYIDS